MIDSTQKLCNKILKKRTKPLFDFTNKYKKCEKKNSKNQKYNFLSIEFVKIFFTLLIISLLNKYPICLAFSLFNW